MVVTGDMVHDLNDAGQVAEFDRLIARIDPAIPVYFTPGNHDVGNEARDRLVEAYIKKYGYDRFGIRTPRRLPDRVEYAGRLGPIVPTASGSSGDGSRRN